MWFNLISTLLHSSVIVSALKRCAKNVFPLPVPLLHYAENSTLLNPFRTFLGYTLEAPAPPEKLLDKECKARSQDNHPALIVCRNLGLQRPPHCAREMSKDLGGSFGSKYRKLG